MLIKVRTLEDSFIYDLGKNYEGYETYLVYGNKGGSLSATYNENGKLIRVIEKYKDVTPSVILYTKAYRLANC
jgi:hypothetical protein